MKKFIFTCLAAFSIISASAENVLAVVPAQATAGSEATLAVNMNNEFEVYTIGINITLPKGFTFKGGGRKGDTFELGKTVTLNNERTEYAFKKACGGNIIKNTDGTVTLKFGGAGDDYVDGTDGKLFDLTIVVDASVAPGVYPIIAEGVEIYDQAVKGVKLETHASYIVVGDASDATLTLEGVVPSFVNEALATEAAVKTLDLTDVTASYGDFTYVAGRNVVAPASTVAANVKFDAPLAGSYGSFCAPVDVNVDCYTLTSCDGTTAVFTPATTAPAGTPVLIDKAVKTAAQAANLQAVAGQDITSGYYVASNGSGMHSVTTSATIPALRGYWPISGSSNLRIAIETPTGIQYIGTADEVFGNTYDLQGRQVQNAHNGVFVVNGKKQFVK